MQSTLKVACLAALLLMLAAGPGAQETQATKSPSIIVGDDSKTGSGTG